MRKDYLKPNLVKNLFLPHEYVAVCEYYLDGIDPLNNASITSSTKFWPDSNQDGIINGTDYDHQSTNQTDGAGWGDATTLVKAWWASSNKVGNDIHANPSLFEHYQDLGEAGYVDAVYDPKNSHYHAGTVKFKKNQS